VPVVVLGSGPTALGVVRCLNRNGLKPYLASEPGDLAGFSRWARSRILHIPGSGSAEQLVSTLERLGLERAVLIPCSDVWTQAVADIPAEARDRFSTSAPPAGVVELFIDKLRFAETLERLGVPMPKTTSVDSATDLDRPLEGFFLKPRHSQQFAQHFHQKALMFDGPEQAQEALELMSAAGFKAVLQEYIPGPPTAHYFIDGFRTKEGSVTALFARRRTRMFPPDLGNSTLMHSVPLAEVQQAADDLVSLLADVNYRGIFSAEFKFDSRDGKYKILEVNSRPWWYIDFASSCGVDVCLMAYRDALGLDVAKLDGYEVGKRCVFLPQDIRAFKELRATKELTLFSWLRSWLGAEPTIFAWDDPLPALLFPWVLLRDRRKRQRSTKQA
jgi:predicted ATP-grasp superfamily ATP-dependent carboligase